MDKIQQRTVEITDHKKFIEEKANEVIVLNGKIHKMSRDLFNLMGESEDQETEILSQKLNMIAEIGDISENMIGSASELLALIRMVNN
jgi:hypothetical protein